MNTHLSSAGIAMVAVILAWILTISAGVSIDNETRGTFGDMFGAVNALFTGAAFVGVVYAVFLQREQIRVAQDQVELTRKELGDTRLILKLQKDELMLRNQEAAKKSFEDTFFQMLKLFTDLTDNLDYRKTTDQGSGIVSQGKDFFVSLNRKLKPENPGDLEKQGVIKYYEDFHSDNLRDLGHYFRTLYNILKFVDSSEVEDKVFYTNILRAQLSDYEVLFIFYNCCSKFGKGKMEMLIMKYQILKHLNCSELFDDEFMSYLNDYK